MRSIALVDWRSRRRARSRSQKALISAWMVSCKSAPMPDFTALTASSRRPVCAAKAFVHKLTEALSGNHDIGTVDMIGSLNRQLAGWAAFYKFTDFTGRTFRRIDHVVFWKMAHWLAQKYRSRIKPLMRNWYRSPETGKAKTWFVYGRSERGNRVGKALRRMVSSHKAQFRWRNPESNPYIFRSEDRNTVTSRYDDVAIAMGRD